MGVFRSLKSVTKLNLDMASVNEEDPLNSLSITEGLSIRPCELE